MLAHSHGRGTQEILAGGSTNNVFRGNSYSVNNEEHTNGAILAKSNSYKLSYTNDSNGSGARITSYEFKASRNWSGTSQSIGSGTAHGHSWTGTASTFSLLNPYKVAYCFIRVS